MHLYTKSAKLVSLGHQSSKKQWAGNSAHSPAYKATKGQSHLWVNHQWPSPCFADDNGIINAKAVIGQAIQQPASDGHRLTQYSNELEVLTAGDGSRPADGHTSKRLCLHPAFLSLLVVTVIQGPDDARRAEL